MRLPTCSAAPASPECSPLRPAVIRPAFVGSRHGSEAPASVPSYEGAAWGSLATLPSTFWKGMIFLNLVLGEPVS